MSTAEFEDYDAFNNRRRKSQRDTILTVEVTCVLSWFTWRLIQIGGDKYLDPRPDDVPFIVFVLWQN